MGTVLGYSLPEGWDCLGVTGWRTDLGAPAMGAVFTDTAGSVVATAMEVTRTGLSGADEAFQGLPFRASLAVAGAMNRIGQVAVIADATGTSPAEAAEQVNSTLTTPRTAHVDAALQLLQRNAPLHPGQSQYVEYHPAPEPATGGPATPGGFEDMNRGVELHHQVEQTHLDPSPSSSVGFGL